MQHFQQMTIRFDPSAFKPAKSKKNDALKNSYERALQRFKGLEKKLDKHKEIKMQYEFYEYIELDDMTLVTSSSKTNT